MSSQLDMPLEPKQTTTVLQGDNGSMSEDDEERPWRVKVSPAPIVKPGQRKPVDTSEIPPLVGKTVKLQVRVDQRTADDIQEHFDRLTKLAGVSVTLSDTLRSLIQKGAAAYRAEFREDQLKEPK